MEARLRQALARAEEVAKTLADPSTASDPARLKALGREHTTLEPIVRLAERLERLESELGQAREMALEADPELVALAKAELARLTPQVDTMRAELHELLLPRDPLDDRDAIVEIRAGTGGGEAALFASELFRMIRRFAERKRLSVEPISLSEGSEAQGRIHTSAATVAVLPEAEDVDVVIQPNDLKIDVFRSSGPGGQSVNTTDSAVRITHLPTGLVVSQQDQKSQLQNKLKAMEVLRARRLARMIAEQEAARSRDRRAMVGTGDRSAKIRTYNFPQSRVTDHRINLSVYDLTGVMDGDLDELVNALRMASRQEMLSA